MKINKMVRQAKLNKEIILICRNQSQSPKFLTHLIFKIKKVKMNMTAIERVIQLINTLTKIMAIVIKSIMSHPVRRSQVLMIDIFDINFE